MENTNKIQENIQLIMNTLQSLDIKADYDTMNKLLGCLQMLGKMKIDAANWIDVNETVKSSKVVPMHKADDASENTDPKIDDADQVSEVIEEPELIPQ